MKNVEGKEVFSSNEEKIEFYANKFAPRKDIQKKDYTLYDEVGKDGTIRYDLTPELLNKNIKTMLDVGADWGKYSIWFIDNLVCTVDALEITQSRVDDLTWLVLSNFPEYGDKIRFMSGDIETIEIDDYDFIFASDVVEHLIDYQSTWVKLLEHSKYLYALIPGNNSWSWSDDHLTVFDDTKILELSLLSEDIIFLDRISYDDKNFWFSLLVKGRL